MPRNAPVPPSTLPLVLLPGTLCDERLFAPLQRRLPGIATRVVLPRHAETLEQAAEAVLAETPQHFALLGFSLGGLVAMEAALRAPDRVMGLGLLSTNPLPVPPDQHLARRAAVALARQLGPAAFLRKHLWPIYTGASASDTAHLALLAFLEAMAESIGCDTFARQTEMALARTDFRPRLPALRCPTFVLGGAEDRVCPPATQHPLAEALSSGPPSLLRHAGHFVLLEQPDRVASHVAAWFHLIQRSAQEFA